MSSEDLKKEVMDFVQMREMSEKLHENLKEIKTDLSKQVQLLHERFCMLEDIMPAIHFVLEKMRDEANGKNG